MNSHHDEKKVVFPLEVKLDERDFEDEFTSELIKDAVIESSGKSYEKETAKKYKANPKPEINNKIKFVYPNLLMNKIIKNNQDTVEDGLLTFNNQEDISLLKCPITKEFFQHPVVAPNGVTYERADIIEYFKKNGKIPSPPPIPQFVQVEINDETIQNLPKNLFISNLMESKEIQAFINFQKQSASAAAAAPAPMQQGGWQTEFVDINDLRKMLSALADLLNLVLKNTNKETLLKGERLKITFKSTKDIDAIQAFISMPVLTKEDAKELKEILEAYFLGLKLPVVELFSIRESASEKNQDGTLGYRVSIAPQKLINALHIYGLKEVPGPLRSRELNLLETINQLGQMQPKIKPSASAASAAAAIPAVGVNAVRLNEASAAAAVDVAEDVYEKEVKFLREKVDAMFGAIINERDPDEQSTASDQLQYDALRRDLDNIFNSPDISEKIAFDIVMKLEAFRRDAELDYKKELVSLGRDFYKRYEGVGYGKMGPSSLCEKIQGAKEVQEAERLKQASQPKNSESKKKPKSFIGGLFKSKDKGSKNDKAGQPHKKRPK